MVRPYYDFDYFDVDNDIVPYHVGAIPARGKRMPQISTECRPEAEPDRGCAYPVDGGGACGAPCRLASPYCAAHHALCYLRRGSPAEARRLRGLEALARAVGGRRTRGGSAPPVRFLDRLERLARALSRPDCS
jgi:hypothetical protein